MGVADNKVSRWIAGEYRRDIIWILNLLWRHSINIRVGRVMKAQSTVPCPKPGEDSVVNGRSGAQYGCTLI